MISMEQGVSKNNNTNDIQIITTNDIQIITTNKPTKEECNKKTKELSEFLSRIVSTPTNKGSLSQTTKLSKS